VEHWSCETSASDPERSSLRTGRPGAQGQWSVSAALGEGVAPACNLALDVTMSSWIEAGSMGTPSTEFASIEVLRRAFSPVRYRSATLYRKLKQYTKDTSANVVPGYTSVSPPPPVRARPRSHQRGPQRLPPPCSSRLGPGLGDERCAARLKALGGSQRCCVQARAGWR
jgi:hypothetical protein